MLPRKSVLAAVFVLATPILATAFVTILAIAALIPAVRGCAIEFVAIEFVTAELPWAPVGKDYAPAPLEVRTSGECPLGGLGFAVVSGALPSGIELSRLGYFSGIASRSGSYDFTVRAANGCSWTSRRFTLVVSAPPVLSIKPERIQFQAVVGEGAPPMQVLRVSASWPHLPYEIAIAGGDWLKALPDQGRSPESPVADKRRLSDTSENIRAPSAASTKKKKALWPFKSDAKKTRPSDAAKNSPEDANNKDPQDGDKTGAADPDNKNSSDSGKPGDATSDSKTPPDAVKTRSKDADNKSAGDPTNKNSPDANRTRPQDAGKKGAADPGRKDSTGGDQTRAIPAGDAVHIRIDASNLKPGYYSATITFSAWQATPASALIELAVLSK